MTEYEKLRARHEARLEARGKPRVAPDYDRIKAELIAEAEVRDRAIADREGLSLTDFRARRAARETEHQRRSGANSIGLS